MKFNPADYGIVYSENNDNRLYKFTGKWDIDKNGSDYKVTPILERVENKIEIPYNQLDVHMR